MLIVVTNMHLSTFTLLIVEDFPESRELYRYCLLTDPSYAYDLLEVESVAAGLELCQTRSIDAILLDYLLPDGDGLKFLESLHAQSNGTSPPVVMLTGQGNESIAVQAMKLGAEDYLRKRDFTPELLQSKIRSAIENASLRRQLQQSEERLRASVENMLDCFGIYSAIRDAAGQIIDFRIDYLNAAALESHRMTAADLGRGLCDVFPAQCEQRVFAEYCQVVDTAQPLFKEDPIYADVSGAQMLVSIYSVHISKLADGFVASWRDVTAQKQAELLLIEKNQQITTIWESMTDAYINLDRDWRIIYANQAATQVIYNLVGFVPAEFLGKTHWEVFPWSVGNLVEQEYRRAATDWVSVHFESLYEPTGTWFEIHAYPSTEGLGIYFRDINNRKQIEMVRIKAEQERDRFFNISLDLLAIGNFDGYFTRLNPASERILGFTSEELMGQPFIDFVHPEDRDRTLACAQRLTIGEIAIDFQNRYRCQDGSYRWLSWSAMPDLEHKLWYASGHDITEQQAVLRERQQAQIALEARNQELDSFVYVVSHDLKAPLRAIANLSQWIEDDLAGVLTADTQQQMDLLRNRVYRMEATIDGLLDYARIGRSDEQIESFGVAQLLAEVIDSIAPPPTFRIDIAPNLPTLYTKRLFLSQIFANLIGNAIVHHDRPDGSIQISCQDRGDVYEFVIADDGPGIAPEYHDRIFTIFQAVNPQNRSDSTGVGLAIVKKIVDTEGGTIWLDSELGKGTKFYFTWLKRSIE
jgi:PAS domain S-box-containing protein